MNWKIRSKQFDSKINHYELFDDIVPVPRYRVFRNIIHLISNFAVVRYEFGGKMVITSEYGDGGKTFIFIDENTKPREVIDFYKDNKLSRFRATEYLNVIDNFSIHSIIGDKKIILSPIVRQIIEDKFFFRGVEYPCHQHWQVKSYTTYISRRMKEYGYRGICNFNFMKTPDQIYFGEINPRFARSTPFVSWAMRKTYSHSLFELDKMARKGEELPLVKKYIDYIKWKMSIKDGKIEFSKET